MGNGQSRINTEYLKAVGAPPMMPVKRSKYSDYRQAQGSPILPETQSRPRTPGFQGTWSVHVPESTDPMPSARCRQISVYDERTNSLIIAYGVDALGNYLNDVWQLDLTTYKWRQVPINLLEPRIDASSVQIGRTLVIFGGRSASGTYFANLHSVNLDTGEVSVFPSTREPEGRASAGLFYNDESIFVWSGFNGRTLDDLCIYSRTEKDWIGSHQVLDLQGRQAAAFIRSTLTPNTHLIFGSTSGPPLARFDSSTEKFEVMKCTGTAPPPELQHAMICVADDYLFVIGGEKESQFTYVYAMNLVRQQWFAFFVQPDNVTTISEDGNWSKVGIFQLPRQHSGSLIYSPRSRALVSIMGSMFMQPPPTSVIAIGPALAVLHLQSDMVAMLS